MQFFSFFHSAVALCVSGTIDSKMVKVMQKHITKLASDVDEMAFETQKEIENLKEMLKNTQENFQTWERRFGKIEHDQGIFQQELSSTVVQVNQLAANQDVIRQEQKYTRLKVDELRGAIQQGVSRDFLNSSEEFSDIWLSTNARKNIVVTD